MVAAIIIIAVLAWLGVAQAQAIGNLMLKYWWLTLLLVVLFGRLKQ